MPIIIAAIFIAAYFYKMAENIGKSGVRRALAAFAVFTAIQIIVGVCLFRAIPVIFGFGKAEAENLRLGGFYLGLILGIVGLFVVNYFLNKVSDSLLPEKTKILATAARDFSILPIHSSKALRYSKYFELINPVSAALIFIPI